MDTPEEQIETLARNIEHRELLARRRAWLLSLVPLVFAGLLLAYTVWQVAGAKLELAQTEAQLSNTSSQLDTVESNLTSLQSQLPTAQAALTQVGEQLTQSQSALETAQQELDLSQSALATAQVDLDSARAFIRKACPINVEAIKEFMNQETPAVEMLRFLLVMQEDNIRWNPGGFSPEEGFDSPDFALYALQNFGFLTDYGRGSRPWNILRPASSLMDGDIVYYDSGYTMFYYNLPVSYGSSDTRECVIGMTPLGIQAQLIDFAESPDYLKAPYNP
ncbi:MAG: hypothetical protein HY869_01405 [Chloroflexi bacterium]|nr:hypothetical protein [Chloroflexota bacterium]